jgi:hypothetical protein
MKPGPAGVAYRPLPAGPVPVGTRCVFLVCDTAPAMPCTVVNGSQQHVVPVRFQGRNYCIGILRPALRLDDALFD